MLEADDHFDISFICAINAAMERNSLVYDEIMEMRHSEFDAKFGHLLRGFGDD